MDERTTQDNESEKKASNPYDALFKEVLMMTGKIPIPEENVKFIVNDLGIERILRNADIDEVVRCIDVKDIIHNLSNEDIRELQTLLNDKITGDKR